MAGRSRSGNWRRRPPHIARRSSGGREIVGAVAVRLRVESFARVLARACHGAWCAWLCSISQLHLFWSLRSLGFLFEDKSGSSSGERTERSWQSEAGSCTRSGASGRRCGKGRSRCRLRKKRVLLKNEQVRKQIYFKCLIAESARAQHSSSCGCHAISRGS